jgi:hypothetical protein
MEDNVATQKERKIKLKEEAEERFKIYSGMSLEEKLELIRSRRGESEKEKAKILKLIKEKDNDKAS